MHLRPLLATAVLLAACGPQASETITTSQPAPEPSAVVAPAPLAPCAPRSAHPALRALDTTGSGSAVVLARIGDRALAFVADEDSSAVHTVDLDARVVLATTPLAGRPAQLLIAPDGRVFAALRDHAAIEVLEPREDPAAPLSRRCLVVAPSEPVALARTPNGATLLVASRWGHALSAFGITAMEPRFTVDLRRDPAAIAVSADGARALVAHAVGGRVSVIDLAPEAAHEPRTLALRSDLRSGGDPPRGRAKMARPIEPEAALARRGSGIVHERPATQVFALVRAADGRVLAPVVLAAPSPVFTYASVYGGTSWNAPSVSSEIATLDPATERVTLAPKGEFGAVDCLLPRGAALDEARSELLVACLGRDEIVAYDVGAKARRQSVLRRWKVAPGPRGVAVDSEASRAVAWSQFDGVLSVFPLGGAEGEAPRAPIEIPVAAHRALPPELDRGRKLFHDAAGGRIASDGRACASCHLDGRDDGLSWVLLPGARQTPMLLGRLPDTAPYGWEGGDKDLQHHFAGTLSRMGGHGISGPERDALFAWVKSLEPPDEPARPVDPRLARGEAIFHDDAAGCSNCHLGDETTDHARHDVKTGIDVWAGGFDTPSLRFISRSAPYLHDGRYPTLSALLTGMDGKMGHTRQLSPDDRDALLAYVASL
jgi:DNA-binding beta-propeller fold protein YncE